VGIVPEDADWNNDLVDRRRDDRRQRDDSNSRDQWLNGVPGWAKGVAIIGIPGTIAIYLVYILANQSVNQFPEVTRQLAALTTAVKLDHETRQQDAVKTEQLYRMLQAICSNTAKTEEARIACR
jgi:hypothetical protein